MSAMIELDYTLTHMPSSVSMELRMAALRFSRRGFVAVELAGSHIGVDPSTATATPTKMLTGTQDHSA